MEEPSARVQWSAAALAAPSRPANPRAGGLLNTKLNTEGSFGTKHSSLNLESYTRIILNNSLALFITISTIKMIPSPDPVIVPASYETVPTTHIKVSHYPAGAETATPVVVVTLNRPEKQNAFTVQMMEDFEKVYPMFDVDERVKVVVLTGAGKTFCAGADLEIGFDHADRERIMDHRDRCTALLWPRSQPILNQDAVAVASLLPSTDVASQPSLQCKAPRLDLE